MKPKKILSLVPLVLLLGACSLQGEQGPKGDTGETGSQGIQGEPGKDGRSIVQIIKTSSDGGVDTYTIVYSDTTTSTFTVTNGKDGDDGHSPEVTINDDGYWCIDGKPASIVAKGDRGDSITGVTSTYDEDGNTIVKITLSTGEERYVTILKGDKGDKGDPGVSVESIKLTSSEGNRDTYTITYSDGSTSTFVVTNGVDGAQGIQGEPGKDGHSPKIEIGENGNWYVDNVDTGIAAKGPKGDKGDKGDTGEKGEPGKDGKDGISVESIKLTSSEGSRDTYTIYYSDGSTSTFVVTNGVDGAQGIQGEPGKDGHSPKIEIGENGNWYVDGVDTGIAARGPKGDKGDKGDTGDQGPKGDTGEKGEPGNDGKDGKDGQDAITYIPCIFNNYDGTKIYEFYYEKGSTIVYDGPTPVKTTIDDSGKTLNWTFTGWDKPLENIQKPTIFTARFEYIVHTCTFVNYDGSVLETKEVENGASATYNGQTPTRPSETSGDQTIEWTFRGWDKPLDNIRKDTVFTAQYDAPNAIKLTFNNYDGTYLYTQYCGLNANVEYEGPTPKRNDIEDDGIITKFEFLEWDRLLKNITGDTTFTAKFSSTDYFRCRFFGDDGALLYTTSTFKGGQATYEGITPTKAQEANGTAVTDFSFREWDQGLSNITAPTDFYPLFDSWNFTGYKVTFKDSNDKEVLYSHYFEENKPARYPYETPWSYDDENVAMFFGWSESIASITKETTVHMVMKTISRKQNGEYPQAEVADDELNEKLNEMVTYDGNPHRLEYDGRKYQGVCVNEWNGEYEYYKYKFYEYSPIRWRCLGQDDEGALLLSEYLLDSRCYHNSTSIRTIDGKTVYPNNYKQSDIRKWLNEDFLDMAFADTSLIKTTAVDNSVSSTGMSSNPYVCETTYDKVFLLSYKEVNDFNYGFYSDGDRKAYATDYTKCQGAEIDTGNNASFWWLRSPTYESYEDTHDYAYTINQNGVILYWSHTHANWSNRGVRPAIRMNLD